MAKMKFTPPQQQAIDVRNGNILVSAAAGSGKTAVLTQRVLSMLTASEPVPADRLVIVTFTLAASLEMQQRIEQKLADLIETDPENQLLRTQQLMLNKAKISTIHSLCSEIIKDNFQLLNLPVDYRLADESELKSVQSEVLEQVLEAYYEENSPRFRALADYFTVRDDRKLREIISTVYDEIRSLPFPENYLGRFLENYENTKPILETPWGEVLKNRAFEMLEKAQRYLNFALSEMREIEEVYSKYGPAFEEDLGCVNRVLSALNEQDWDRACTTLRSYDKPRVTSVRGFDKEVLEYLRGLRAEANALMDKVKSEYLFATQEETNEDFEILSQQISTLFEVVKQYSVALKEEKRKRSMIDFSDLEHFTLELLIVPSKTSYQKTELAIHLSEYYEEIMVDECQDINMVQNLIFWALSKSSSEVSVDADEIVTDSQNLFLVGDVKQSVYRFRNAMPKLFVSRNEQFSLYDETKYQTGDNVKILLQNNFRSRTEVTESVNELFTRLMTTTVGDVSYGEEEALVPSASYLPNPAAKTEFHLLNFEKKQKKTVEYYQNSDDDDAEEEGKLDREAGYIAKRIQAMIASGYSVQDSGGMRPCTYRDFCILLRSKKGKVDRFAEKLKQHGISCYADQSVGYFDSFEISVMLNLLRVLDNPLQDTALFSVLISPMFGFSPDKLVEIRLKNRKTPLYLNVQQCAEEGDLDCQALLHDLKILRDYAIVLPVDRLIQKIYDQTGFLFVVESMVAGEQKRANLRLLLSYAQGYEKIGYRGLDGFIRFVDRAIERGDDFSCANTVSERADVVRIMSIHGSKGLEFPICIVADTAKGFNTKDLNKSYLMNSMYGFGMKVRKPEELKEYLNLPLAAIRSSSKQEVLSEELRVLYVALTRAKEKLIIVASEYNMPKRIESLLKNVQFDHGVNPFLLLSQNSYFAWIVSALYDSKSLYSSIGLEGGTRESTIDCHYVDMASEAESEEEEETLFTVLPDEEIVHQLEQALTYVYPHEELTHLPTKLSVTQLVKSPQGMEEVSLKPLEISEIEQLTGAQRGTILHNFMQYADFSSAQSDLDKELKRLEIAGFLTPKEIKALNRKSIEQFLQSNLLKRMNEAQEVHREYSFFYEIDAIEVETDLSEAYAYEKILLQGIADAVFEEEDGMVIVDYKTDYLKTEEEFLNRYQKQLQLYHRALGEYFEKPIKQCFLYSLHLGKEIVVTIE